MNNKRLVAKDIFGIWAGVTMCWNKDYSNDAAHHILDGRMKLLNH
jgi:hypothetical protein